MQLNDLLKFTRILLAEPSNQQRWSDADLTTLVNQAQSQIALELDWPEQTLTAYTTPNVQEYQLPEMLKILRVYIAGQPIVPTSIPALQGDQIEMWDQTGTSASGNTNQTQWQTQAAANYPNTNNEGTGPSAGNTPWSIGARPRFYMRGGNMGFVPIPSGFYTAQIDCIPAPPPLVNMSDVTIYPTNFKDAICWKTCEYAFFGDSNVLQAQATINFQAELKKLRAWKEDMVKMIHRGVFPITARTYFRGPVNLRTTSNGRMGG